MKKSLLLIAITLCFCSCNLGQDELPMAEVSIIGMFVVDATTNTFEGGANIVLEKAQSVVSELPVLVSTRVINGNSPGAVALTYSPIGLQFFDAELNQAGIPRFFKPDLIAPTEYGRVDDQFVSPNANSILDLEGPYDEPFQTTFEAINDLEVLDIFFRGNGLFGRYLYKPSEDVPENWKWIIVAYAQ